ncbi:MAG: peptide deformylase [Pseudomonadales bacterium]|nr:peptide deformylase [Pseudomonadales bacterium]
MTIKEIARMGDPILRKVATPYPINKIGSFEFNQLVQDMQETLHFAQGIGLAAPQIKVSSQLVVIEIKDTSSRYGEIPAIPFSVYINPTINVINAETKGYWEGCLSVPGMMGFVERPQHIVINYLDQQANSQSLELKGFLATVFQHEFDHLQGKLYVDQLKDMQLFAFEDEYKLYHQQTE